MFKHDIAWGDMDAFGHVNNARYFAYFEMARVSWLRTFVDIQGNSFGSNTTGPVIKSANIEYLKPIVFPATINICLTTSNIRRSGFTIEYTIKQDNIIHARGGTIIVWVDLATGKPIALPELIKSNLS
jgi:acyl-CoA thioester hydrolase